jgi:acyl-coenzyme A thioesterase PaaI-like protein
VDHPCSGMTDSQHRGEVDGVQRRGALNGPTTTVERGTDATGAPAESAAARAAGAVRRLGHELVAHLPDPALLHHVAAAADDLVAAVTAAPLRRRHPRDTLERLAEPAPPDGALLDHGTVCPVSGAENPLGLAMTTWRAGEEVLATVTLGSAAAGSPGIAHGGVIAALFDDLMGFVLDSLARTPGVTANLSISYRKTVPIGAELELRGRLRRREGRKLFIEGAMSRDGEVLAEAEALFIAVKLPAVDEEA